LSDDEDNFAGDVEDEDAIEEEGVVDELNVLDAGRQSEVLKETGAVRNTLTKVRKLSFAVIHSSTIVLPAWCRACKDHGLTPRLIPHDVVTRWNSTYDMVKFALSYRKPVDDI
ncbi:hypothetical protein OE88DRAFT_1614846, partial [Heliocybe sulcata]